MVTIDQEGGRVSRLRLIGNEPPSAQQLRYKGEAELIEWHGRLTGKLLRLFGFNLDLCPVLDISFDDEADNSLKGRCYGGSVGEVVANAEVFRAAMAGEGILSLREAFPGLHLRGAGPASRAAARSSGRGRNWTAVSWRCSGSSRGGSTA